METYDTLKREDSFEKFSMDCLEIQEYQQNRYPYLFLDHVDEIEPGKYARGFKNYTINEWFSLYIIQQCQMFRGSYSLKRFHI